MEVVIKEIALISITHWLLSVCKKCLICIKAFDCNGLFKVMLNVIVPAWSRIWEQTDTFHKLYTDIYIHGLYTVYIYGDLFIPLSRSHDLGSDSITFVFLSPTLLFSPFYFFFNSREIIVWERTEVCPWELLCSL